jgi:hypothetical protein
MVLAGCSTSWIGEAEQIVAVLIPAAANLLTLAAALEGKTVSAADMQMIQSAGTQAGADLELIQSLIAAYQKADAAAQPGILNQIEAAINSVQTNLQGLLPALHIKDAATQAKVTAVIGMVLAEVQSLAALVPIVKGQSAVGSGQWPENTHPVSAKSAETRVGQPRHPSALVVKAPLTASEFVASYNATMTAKTGNAAVDRVAAGLKIHEHGKTARVVSLGIVK